MPAAAAGVVLAWTGSTAVAAVAGAVVTGAITGAVVGAVSAMTTGGDIFKGALKGAAIGGVTGGVISGLGMATGLSSTATQLGKLGVEGFSSGVQPGGVTEGLLGSSADVPAKAGEQFGMSADVVAGGNTGSNLASTGLLDKAASTAAAPGLSDSTAKVLAGVGQGAFQGAGQYLAAGEEAESVKNLEEFRRQNQELDKASNIPGKFETQTANITTPDWWTTHLDPNFNNSLLTGKNNAKTVPNVRPQGSPAVA